MSATDSVSVPVLSLLFSDSLIAVIVIEIVEPAGMTVRPLASFRSSIVVAVTVCPALFFLELIESSIVALIIVPNARLAGAAAGFGVDAGAGAGAGAGFGLGRAAAGFGAGAGAGSG